MPSPVIIFRTEGGHKIGLGHIKRCLNLADFLARQFPIQPLFILSPSDVPLKKLFQGRPYEILLLEEEEDPKFLQRQCLEHRPRAWITDLRKTSRKSFYQNLAEKYGFLHMAIDDMHLCGVQAHATINPSIVPCSPSQHSNPQGKYFCGAEFFFHFPKNSPPAFPKKNGKRVLVSMGGSDPDRVTERLWKAFHGVGGDVEVHMVIGPAFAWKMEPSLAQKAGNVFFHHSPEDLQPLLSSVDVVVTPGGLTIYESVRAGVPAICVPQNPFESKTAKALAELGAALPMGNSLSFNPDDVVGAAVSLLENRTRREEMSKAGQGIFTGSGAEKVKELIGQI